MDGSPHQEKLNQCLAGIAGGQVSLSNSVEKGQSVHAADESPMDENDSAKQSDQISMTTTSNLETKGDTVDIFGAKANDDSARPKEESRSNNQKDDCKKEEDEDEDEEEIFCICRTPDIDRFMIACDNCMEWFHGDCVGVENKRAAKKIKEWYCQRCLEEKSDLQIVYKKKKERNIDDEDMKQQHKRKSRQCGECPACVRKEDCNTCDFCKDMKKFGGPGKLRQKCRKRQCHLLSRVRKRESEIAMMKDFPEKVKRTQEDIVTSIKTEHQYTRSTMGDAQDTTSKLTTSVKPSISSLLEAISEEESHSQQATQQQYMSDHCYSMYGAPPQLPNSQSSDNSTTEVVKKKALKVKRASGSRSLPKSKSKNHPSTVSKPAFAPKREKEKENRRNFTNKLQPLETFSTNRTTRSSRKEKEKGSPPRQCLGPGCVNAARQASKYCSNECGVQLQIRRLQVILPERKKTGKESSYYATKLCEDNINTLRKTQKKCQDTLLELDNECKRLEEMLEESQALSPLEEEENEEEERDSDLDLTTYCVSCGVPLAPRIAFRHMEKCWSKLECLMSFGALMKSAGNLFCDTYMNQQGTYCKRLKVMCPEHYKEKKVEPSDVCGCPLVDEHLKETSKYCRIPRKKCTRHVAWERLRRGEIDLKRVHQWWKLEESYEQERQLRLEISNRNNVLGVMLNNTYDHSNDASTELDNKSDVAKTEANGLDNVEKTGSMDMERNIEKDEKDRENVKHDETDASSLLQT